MIKSIDATTPKYSKTNKNFTNQRATALNSLSFGANLCKTAKPKNKFISFFRRFCEELGDSLSPLKLRIQRKLDCKFGKMSEDGKELSNRINTILGDKRKVRITKNTVLVVNPELTPKEIMKEFLNDSLPPEQLKANAEMFRDIANNYNELPFSMKPIITGGNAISNDKEFIPFCKDSMPEEDFKRLQEFCKKVNEASKKHGDKE